MRIDKWADEIIKNANLMSISNFYHKTQCIENSFAKSSVVEIWIAKPNALKKSRYIYRQKNMNAL